MSSPMKPPVILFDPPNAGPEITKSPADYYRNIFSPGVKEEVDQNAETQPAKTESSKP